MLFVLTENGAMVVPRVKTVTGYATVARVLIECSMREICSSNVTRGNAPMTIASKCMDGTDACRTENAAN